MHTVPSTIPRTIPRTIGWVENTKNGLLNLADSDYLGTRYNLHNMKDETMRYKFLQIITHYPSIRPSLPFLALKHGSLSSSWIFKIFGVDFDHPQHYTKEI